MHNATATLKRITDAMNSVLEGIIYNLEGNLEREMNSAERYRKLLKESEAQILELQEAIVEIRGLK